MSAPVNSNALILPAGASLYLFDFCGTLFDSRTTQAFLVYMGRFAGRAYRVRHAVRWTAASLLRRVGLLSPPAYMRMRVRALKGVTAERIERGAEAFVRDLMNRRARTEILDALREVVRRGEPAVIVSFTLAEILAPFARQEGVDRTVASSLAYDARGRCTGRYARQLKLQGKRRALLERYDETTVRGACLVTDDADADRDLFEYVRFPLDVKRGISS